MKFSTYDRDNDRAYNWMSCARTLGGGWWFNNCGATLPTGKYKTGGENSFKGVNWFYARNSYYSFKTMTFTLIPV